MGNNFGLLFRISTWGESHGGGVGVVIDGCPPGITIDMEQVQDELNRRRPGQNRFTTQRKEADQVELLSGVFEGQTLGTPIAMLVRNHDAKSGDYDHVKDTFRPSHADFTYEAKFGFRDWRGGGRTSARETIGRVAAGAIAKQVLKHLSQIHIVGYVTQIQSIKADLDPCKVEIEKVEASMIRCPDPKASEKMEKLIQNALEQGDSLGGVIEVVARNVPAGLGEPVFDRLEADLAKAMLSLPASKGFEVGSGFQGIEMMGSAHNDPYVLKDKKIGTSSNYSGGIQGGISNGEPIVIRIAFKPTATIRKAQMTVNRKGEKMEIKGRGRHDPCVLPRAVPMVESMMALVLLDHFLRQRGQCGGITMGGFPNDAS